MSVEHHAESASSIVWPVDPDLRAESRALASRKIVVQPYWLADGVTDKVFHHIAGDWIARFVEVERESRAKLDAFTDRLRRDLERIGKQELFGGAGAWRRQFPNARRVIERELRAQKTLIMTSVARTLIRDEAPWCGVAAHMLGAADVALRRRKRECKCESIRAQVETHGGTPGRCPKHDAGASSRPRASHALRQRVDELGGDVAVRLAAVIAFLPYLHPTVATLLLPVRAFANDDGLHYVFPRDGCGDGFPPAPFQEVEFPAAIDRLESVPWHSIRIYRGRRPDTPHLHHARVIGLVYPTV